MLESLQGNVWRFFRAELALKETTAARVLSLCEEMMRWVANLRMLWDRSWSWKHNLYMYIQLYTWNPKQPVFNGCLVKDPFFMWWFGALQLKQPLERGCFRYVYIYTCMLMVKKSSRDSHQLILREHALFGVSCASQLIVQDFVQRFFRGSLSIKSCGESKSLQVIVKSSWSDWS